MPSVLVIQNPVAGTQSAEHVTQQIRSHLRSRGWDYKIHHTHKDDDIPALVSSFIDDGYGSFIAAGGDGTVSAIASGLVEGQIPLGILPIGTGNGLARDLNIPLTIEKALDLFTVKPAIKRLDAMRVNDRYYLLNLSVGLTPLAMEITEREQKRRLGRLAYLVAGLRSLVGVQPNTFGLSIDGVERNFNASELLLMNSVTLGDPGRYLNLGIENDDEKLDLFVIQSKSAADYFRVFMNLILRQPTLDPDVQRYHVKESLVIQGDKIMQVQADGELIGPTPVRVNLVPKAVPIIVPE